jgi:hypothetical protein
MIRRDEVFLIRRKGIARESNSEKWDEFYFSKKMMARQSTEAGPGSQYERSPERKLWRASELLMLRA